MATIESWAVDLADVGAVYPMVGTEGALVIILAVFWIGWHVWQFKHENKCFQEELDRLSNPEDYAKAMRDSK